MEKHEIYISYFDKKTEELIDEMKLKIGTEKLRNFLHPYKGDINYNLVYEIGYREANEIKKLINMEFDFNKYNYYIQKY